MKDEDVEARLARWRPAEPPLELMRRLRAVAPSASARRRPWLRAGGWFGGSLWRPWPLAYAGLLTAWALILALRLLTPSDPGPAARPSMAQTDPAPTDVPAFAGTLAAKRTFLLDRNNLDQL